MSHTSGTNRRTTLKAIAGAGALAALPAALHAQTAPGRFIEYSNVAALGLPDQRLTIWLPPDYDAGTGRFRVLYMHDAQNLFDPALSNFNKVWAADRAMLNHADAHGEDPWIIIGIWSPGEDRYRQYMPRSAYDAAGPVLRAKMDQFGNGKPIVSREYIDWIAGTLRPWVNRSFRTLTARDDTAIVGSSMGGLISLYAFLEYPAIFGRAGCVSTHWPAIAPQSVDATDPEVLDIWQNLLTTQLGETDGRRLWFDHGTATLDAFYPPYQRAIDTLMQGSGWERGSEWESRVYPGAEHEENAWAARLPEIYDWVLG
ncbi:hypothetical protein NAP1_09662 [Erythrobacter sp. NAP1]|nr:hypothetical protein NAP1_09662 [Erythrobacter sp. NAP1]